MAGIEGGDGFEFSYPAASSRLSGSVKVAPYYSPRAERARRRKTIAYSVIIGAAIIGVVGGVYWTPKKSQASSIPKDRTVSIRGDNLEHKVNH